MDGRRLIRRAKFDGTVVSERKREFLERETA